MLLFLGELTKAKSVSMDLIARGNKIFQMKVKKAVGPRRYRRLVFRDSKKHNAVSRGKSSKDF